VERWIGQHGKQLGSQIAQGVGGRSETPRSWGRSRCLARAARQGAQLIGDRALCRPAGQLAGDRISHSPVGGVRRLPPLGEGQVAETEGGRALACLKLDRVVPALLQVWSRCWPRRRPRSREGVAPSAHNQGSPSLSVTHRATDPPHGQHEQRRTTSTAEWAARFGTAASRSPGLGQGDAVGFPATRAPVRPPQALA